MSTCWHCHWGWSKPVHDIYQRAVEDLGEDILHWGPSHIVFEDENFDDGNVRYCIEACDKHEYWVKEREFQPEDLEGLKGYLVELLAIPEAVRDPAPADYDGRNPENFPPTVEMMGKP